MTVELATTFADASLEMNATGDKFRVAQTLQNTVAGNKTKLDTLAAGQVGTVGTLTADAYHETPAAPAYAATLTLDTSVKNDFEVGVLTGNTVITLSNPARGRQGYVAVKQDATGSRTVTIQATGYTTRRESGTADLVAAPGANAETIYAYLMYQLGGTNCLMLTKLTPV